VVLLDIFFCRNAEEKLRTFVERLGWMLRSSILSAQRLEQDLGNLSEEQQSVSGRWVARKSLLRDQISGRFVERNWRLADGEY
jgi:hypothetical protein